MLDNVRRTGIIASIPLMLIVVWWASRFLLISPAVTANSASSTETARSALDFLSSVGINVHLNYFDTLYGQFPLVQRELGLLGVRHVRDGIHLQDPDYNRMLYQRWIVLGHSGVRFDAVLDPRSNLGPVTASLLERIDQLTGHSIESFEGPNELDVSKLGDWASIDRDYQEAICSSVRSMTGRRSIRIIGPSMAFASNSSRVGSIGDCIDAGNLHPYPSAKMPSIIFPEQMDLATSISGNKAVVFTESGYHNALNDHSDQPPISESAAAKYIPRLFLETFSRGIPRTYLYEFMDETPDPELTHFQLHWGLIRSDGSEKPAFVALKNLMTELSDKAQPASLEELKWSLTRTNAQTHHLLLEKSSGEFDLVLWQEVNSYDLSRQMDIANEPLGTVLILGKQASQVEVYEPTVQGQAMRVYNNLTAVPLGIPDHPLVVKMRFR